MKLCNVDVSGICLFILIVGAISNDIIIDIDVSQSFNFTKDFIFGVSSSAYQIEGGWNISGKGESTWDSFTHKKSSLISDNSNGDIASDSYHKYKEDVKITKSIGFQMYKFSLSWSRILPKGTVDKINQQGIDYYEAIIDELKSNGIEPMVSLYHWDLPKSLEDNGGWLNASTVTHFKNYSRLIFKTFGSKVKWWLTMDDPLGAAAGYGMDEASAPGLEGLHGFGEYRAGHNLLRAHAAAAQIYKKEFFAKQKGKISFSLKADFIYPKTNTSNDIEAAETAMQFTVGWFGNPVYGAGGDYPSVMRDYVDRNSALEGLKQSRLPYFTMEEIQQIRGSSDFLAFSHRTSKVAELGRRGPSPSWSEDSNVQLSFDQKWKPTDCKSMKVVSEGLEKIMSWLAEAYGEISMFITENSYCDRGEIQDDKRVEYYKEYLSKITAAKKDGLNVFGYCTTLLDDFQWKNGYREKYGIIHVNISDASRKRTMKTSAHFWKNLLQSLQ